MKRWAVSLFSRRRQRSINRNSYSKKLEEGKFQQNENALFWTTSTGIGKKKKKKNDRSVALGRRERGWYTLASLLEGGEFGDHGLLITCISGDQEL